MPLSTRYVVMINDALNAIPIQQHADFALAAAELHKILLNQPELFDSQFKDQIETLHEFLIEADVYAASEELDEYCALIRAMIQNEIDAFNALTPKQKAVMTHRNPLNLRG